MDALTAAADRFFRAYAMHCLDPDEDTLFAMLHALHSINDKLDRSKAGIGLSNSAVDLALPLTSPSPPFELQLYSLGRSLTILMNPTCTLPQFG